MPRTADTAPAASRDAGNPIIPAWKPDWPAAAKRHEGWWRGEDLVLAVTAPLDEPRLPDLPQPADPADARDKWIGLPGRVLRAEWATSRTFFGGEAVPTSGALCVGPGDLAAMLGAGWHFSENTVWYEPCIADPASHPPLKLDRSSFAFERLTELTQAHLKQAAGRYFTGIPDLIENIDILAALREPQVLLMDMFDHPEWIEQSMFAINQAFFEAYDHFYQLTRDANGAAVFDAFTPWGPGKTAKVQCDACSMFGPAQFGQFVVPALTEQCEWLDFSMYHLDGEECWPNLDLLLSIDALDAVEWTPKRVYADEGGGHPKWYDLYRRIRAAGKSVQAINVQPEEVIPLLDAVGPKGMFIQCRAATQAEAEALLAAAAPYYARD